MIVHLKATSKIRTDVRFVRLRLRDATNLLFRFRVVQSPLQKTLKTLRLRLPRLRILRLRCVYKSVDAFPQFLENFALPWTVIFQQFR